ncbi:MAG: ATP-binding cassette domain-containing protein [Prevotellaceae bacterium]|jgi:ABC-2 type transport system ATP-binding protein|nr:ATP-binding cassette domain-containing protein [Prevotellaceae bacterium]
MNNILEIKNVVKQYSGHLALDGVSLSVPEQTIYGLLGPNGAGKTTLIRIINHIIAPDTGEALLNGAQISAADVAQIGYMPEERGLYKKMKIGEQALYLARLKGMTKNDALHELRLWFRKFEIESWWGKKVEELSKGMAQKVQFITTVIHKPKLLIFDEPFSGFDPVNAALLTNEILELRNAGATVIFSTHNMASVEELCENIALINRAKVVLKGNIEEIRAAHSTCKFLLRTVTELTENKFVILNKNILRNGNFEYLITKEAQISNNELITEILRQTQIISFEEQLPTMNDIFIETVQK